MLNKTGAINMTPFEHTVCQLMIGVESRPSPESQTIACKIVETHMIPNQKILGVTTHYAVDQTTVDLGDDL
jgi:hypothetical protein